MFACGTLRETMQVQVGDRERNIGGGAVIEDDVIL
jgi:hypothetical protein